MPYDFEKEIVKKRKNILKTMKNYINNELNSSKKNYDSKRSDFQEANSIEEIINSCLTNFVWDSIIYIRWQWLPGTSKKPPNSFLLKIILQNGS